MYKLYVIRKVDGGEKWEMPKWFLSYWLRAAYMRALRNKYSDEEFSSKLYLEEM
jgi:hypothetical protein